MKGIKPPECGHSCCGSAAWTRTGRLNLAPARLGPTSGSGQPNQAYTLVPITLTASLKIDNVSLDNFLGGWLRGYSEFYFQGEYEQIVHGPENHYEGILVGPRYNFVQPGWKIIPFVEGGVGMGFTDSNPARGRLWAGLQLHLLGRSRCAL